MAKKYKLQILITKMKNKQLGITNAVVASGPVIIKDKKMLVVLDDKDNFLKFPGGSIFKNKTLKETCKIETKQEICVDIDMMKIKDFQHAEKDFLFLA